MTSTVNMLTCFKIIENVRKGRKKKNQWMIQRNGKHPNIGACESSSRITEINKCTTLSSLPLRYVPLGSGGGIRPSLTFSCSSFCASLLVCLRSFFCSFLVRYTPRVTGVSLSTAMQRNESTQALSLLEECRWISSTLKETLMVTIFWL